MDFVSNRESLHAQGPGLYFTSSKNDAEHYGDYIHTVEMAYKPKLLPERKLFSKNFVKNFIKQSPNLTDILSDWAENKSEALHVATNQFFDIYGPYEYKDGCLAIWRDFFYGYEKEWCEFMARKYDGFTNDMDTFDGHIQHFICFNPAIVNIVNVEKV